MTVYVSESFESIGCGLSKMKSAMIEDYEKFMPPTDEVRASMLAEFIADLTITYGKKYIKITEKRGGVKAFVVNVDNDKKFKNIANVVQEIIECGS